MSHCLPFPTFQQTSKQKVLVTSVMEGNTILGTLMLTFTLLNLRSDKDRCRAHSAFLLLSQVKQRSSCLCQLWLCSSEPLTSSGGDSFRIPAACGSELGFELIFLPNSFPPPPPQPLECVKFPSHYFTTDSFDSLLSAYSLRIFCVNFFFFFLKHMRIIFHHPNLANSGAWGN